MRDNCIQIGDIETRENPNWNRELQFPYPVDSKAAMHVYTTG